MPGAEFCPSNTSGPKAESQADVPLPHSSDVAASIDPRVVAALVRDLTLHERLVVCLRYADGLSVAEIAGVLNAAVDDVERLLTQVSERARVTIRSVASAA